MAERLWSRPQSQLLASPPTLPSLYYTFSLVLKTQKLMSISTSQTQKIYLCLKYPSPPQIILSWLLLILLVSDQNHSLGERGSEASIQSSPTWVTFLLLPHCVDDKPCVLVWNYLIHSLIYSLCVSVSSLKHSFLGAGNCLPCLYIPRT